MSAACSEKMFLAPAMASVFTNKQILQFLLSLGKHRPDLVYTFYKPVILKSFFKKTTLIPTLEQFSVSLHHLQAGVLYILLKI